MQRTLGHARILDGRSDLRFILTLRGLAAYSWLTKVRYISTKYTMGTTVSTPSSMMVGAGQLPDHMR